VTRLFAGSLGLLRSMVVSYAIPFRMRKMRSFYRTFLRPGDLAFDVGAHLGNRVQAWVTLGATVVAVEPQPACMRLLRILFSRQPRVHLVDKAVSDTSEPVVLHVSSRHPTLATVSSRWVSRASAVTGFSHVRWDRTTTVRTCSLDELIARHGRPRFIKIDVEGHEAHVLKSLSVPVESVSFEFFRADLEVAIACVDRLGSLADYEFNLSIGETLKFHSTQWVDAAGVKAMLRLLPARVTSGDVYACRSNHGRQAS
jgi:FkbM family methyltransferase